MSFDRKQWSKDKYQRLIETKSKDAPFCLCGCGQKTKWSIRTKSYGRYLFNHQFPDLTRNWNQIIEQIVRGTILGDGYLDVRKSRRNIHTGLARLAIRHSPKRQLEYIQYLHRMLQPITTSRVRIRKTPKAYGESIAEFSTVSHPKLYEIWQETYKNGKKIVTREFLDKLTDFAFTIWWSDDGSSSSISTHSFTIRENKLIVKWLKDRYNCRTKIQIDKRINLPYISCNSEAMRVLAQIVFPHLEKSLWYKLARFLPLSKVELSASNHTL